ncbi:ATP-binding cassette domain-containing protein [Lactococcus lactis]|uniref:Lantibiotic transport ATP-binding protein SrtF n=1 Tax=Lactococcus lactis subsp. lactis TaxID=1360 RepID=A0A2N5WCU7_LACLL|nr:ABC transporter ATP-binding protein [Lactococcus lactis]PLW60069.1 Lantibiotic transport ATP-binding protein SrtF [Lactococcus lactis subsp. lactis]
MEIKIENLTFSYSYQKILENCTYKFETGKIIVLLGRNGAGKSTLFDLLTDNLKADFGEIIHFAHHSYGYMSDDFFYYRHFSLKKMAELIKVLREINDTDFKTSYSKYLLALGLEEYENKHISELSAGTKQRVHLFLTLLNEPNELYLDEPTNALDPEQIYQFKRIIKDLKSENRIILISTHSLELAATLGDELVVLANKKLYPLQITENLEEEYLTLQKMKS